MSGDYTMYRMFYFFLFAYATYTCMSACIRGRRLDDEQEQRTNDNAANNNSNENNNEPRGTPAEEQAKRRDKVRSNLEFRKILSSSAPGKMAELGPPLDVESGEGGCNSIYENVDASSLELLSEMGFTLNASRKALSAVGGSDTEAAMDWIFDHQHDPNLDADIETPNSNNRSSNNNNNNNATNLTPYVESTDDSKISEADGNSNRLDGSVRSFVTASMSFLTRVGLAGTDPKNEECCSICLEAYKVGDTVARLKRTPEQLEREKKGLQPVGGDEHHNHDGECNHWFHEDCILEWLQNHDECPLCRVDMVRPEV